MLRNYRIVYDIRSGMVYGPYGDIIAEYKTKEDFWKDFPNCGAFNEVWWDTIFQDDITEEKYVSLSNIKRRKPTLNFEL